MTITRRVSRRNFLAAAAAAWPAVPAARSRHASDASRQTGARAIRILAAIEGHRDDLRAGIELGAQEMQHTLRLLGRTLDVTWATAEQLPNLRKMFASARVVGYTAALVALDAPPEVNAWTRAGLPVLALTAIQGTEVAIPPGGGPPEPAPDAPSRAVGAGAPPSRADATARVQPPPPAEETSTPAAPGRWLFRIRAAGGRREWHPGLDRFGAGELNERFRRRTGRGMTADAWCGWIAVKAVAEASLHARSTAPADLADALRALRFDGHKGEPLYFDDEQRLVQPLYD